MPFRQVGPIRFYQFSSLMHPNIVHAIFTRHGGVSPPPWDSLNLGGTVGDIQDRVSENRTRALQSLNLRPESVYDVWQVHSSRVVIVREPRGGEPHQQADAMITDQPGISLLMRFADCVPILLVDPVRSAVGIVHAGWMGTVRGAVRAAVQVMRDSIGCKPGNLYSGIGPSIGMEHYPVGPEVVEQVRQGFGASADNHLHSHNGKVYFDLWSANDEWLRRVGVARIENSNLCTACHLDDWYSHRGERGRTGRFGAVIAIQEKRENPGLGIGFATRENPALDE